MELDGHAEEVIKKKLVTPRKAKKLAKKRNKKKKDTEKPYEFDEPTLPGTEVEDNEVDDEVKNLVTKTEDERRLSEIYR